MPTLVKPRSKRKGQPARTSSIYHIRYYSPFLRRSTVISTRCKSRRNAEKRLREFCDLLEQGEIGRENPFLLQRRKRIDEADRLAIDACLAAFECDLRAGRVRRGQRKPVSKTHADLTLARIRKIVEGCSVRRANDLSSDAVNSLLDRLQSNGDLKSAQTRKHYERAIKSFSRWLAVTGRLDHDRLGRLDVTHVGASDVVHDRGAFTDEEIAAIAAAARDGQVSHGLTGQQRALLYLLAASSGLRAKECASVENSTSVQTWPLSGCQDEFTKNDQDAMQPLPSFLRPALADLTAEMADDEFLWPGGWQQDAKGRWVEAGWIAGKEAGMFLRADAAKVHIVIGRKGKEANGGRVLDFHSFRHSYVSALDRAGISEGLSRKLARASSRAILERYTHREFEELARAAETMPAIRFSEGSPPQLAALPQQLGEQGDAATTTAHQTEEIISTATHPASPSRD